MYQIPRVRNLIIPTPVRGFYDAWDGWKPLHKFHAIAAYACKFGGQGVNR